MSFICIYIFPVAPCVRGTKTVALYTVPSALNLYPMYSGPLLCQRWTSCQEFTQVDVLIDSDVHVHPSPLVSVPPLSSCISFKSFAYFKYQNHNGQLTSTFSILAGILKKKGKGASGRLLRWMPAVVKRGVAVHGADYS